VNLTGVNVSERVLTLEDFYDGRRQARPCVVARALPQLDDDIREVFAAAMHDPDAITTRIAHHFNAYGIKVGPESIRRHRSAQCKCPRDA
jgi:hypothetical protein